MSSVAKLHPYTSSQCISGNDFSFIASYVRWKTSYFIWNSEKNFVHVLKLVDVKFYKLPLLVALNKFWLAIKILCNLRAFLINFPENDRKISQKCITNMFTQTRQKKSIYFFETMSYYNFFSAVSHALLLSNLHGCRSDNPAVD